MVKGVGGGVRKGGWLHGEGGGGGVRKGGWLHGCYHMQKQTPDLIWGPTYRIAALGSYPFTVKYNFIIFVISTLYTVLCVIYIR